MQVSCVCVCVCLFAWVFKLGECFSEPGSDAPKPGSVARQPFNPRTPPLPGEAQKIDRIMEKFAERYVSDNPGKFATADGAYMLAFAIIMLNTDYHNPLAERRLGKADFVAMNSGPVPAAPVPAAGLDGGLGAEGGEASELQPAATALASYQPVLPVEELEAIYSRSVVGVIVGQSEERQWEERQ